MLTRKTRISKYTLRVPSPRVIPSSSLSDIEWDNEPKKNRKTTLRWSSKKIRYNAFALGCGLTAAILITIAIVVPLTITSKPSTTKNTETALALLGVTNIPNTSIISTNLVTTTSSTTITQITSTSTASETTTSETPAINQRTSTSTLSQIASVSTTTETSTVTQSTSISTTSQTTSTTQSTNTSTTSETTSTAQSTSTTTTSQTTSTTQTTSTSTTSTTQTTSTSITSTTQTTSTSTTSETTSTSQTTSTSTTSITTTSTVTISHGWNKTGTSVLGAVGNAGTASNHLNYPIGIVFDSSDTLYIADARNNRVQKLLLGNTAATTVAGNPSGTAGLTTGLLNYTNDVAVDSNGNVYVVDSYNSRIELWYVNASLGITIAGNDTAGNSTTQLDTPRGIALDSNSGIYYVSDSDNNRVMSYTVNSTVGTLVAGGNGPGNSNTQLNDPRGLYFDSTTNSLFIANFGGNNVVRWVIGALSWTLVAGNINGAPGSGSTTLNGPWDVTLDPMGNIYIADRYNNRIQFLLAGQMNATTIAGMSGISGTSSAEFNQPMSVALDSQLNLYVSDLDNERIQKFTRY